MAYIKQGFIGRRGEAAGSALAHQGDEDIESQSPMSRIVRSAFSDSAPD